MAAHVSAATFSAMVDVNGPIRLQMLRAFLLVDPDLTDAELHTKYWPTIRVLVGDLLGRSTCPRCNGRAELSARGVGPDGWVLCQICGGVGYGYDSNLVAVAPLVDQRETQMGLGPAPTGQADQLVDWDVNPRPWPRGSR